MNKLDSTTVIDKLLIKSNYTHRIKKCLNSRSNINTKAGVYELWIFLQFTDNSHKCMQPLWADHLNALHMWRNGHRNIASTSSYFFRDENIGGGLGDGQVKY
jgi:hypothetical protein